MTPEQFTFWLDGFLQGKNRDLTELETLAINQALQTVFVKKTPFTAPKYGDVIPADSPYSNISYAGDGAMIPRTC